MRREVRQTIPERFAFRCGYCGMAAIRIRRLVFGLTLMAPALLAPLVGGGRPGEETPTFSRDVAPILAAHCAGCHREGGPAPFPLESYREARNHAQLIEAVTGRGLMPPWKPAAGHGEFAGARRLSDAQRGVLRSWVEAGAPEGDARPIPSPAVQPANRPRGAPDLVLRAPAPFDVPADGPDVSHTFVIPVDVPEVWWARAVEFRTGIPRVARHARFELAGSRHARELLSAARGGRAPRMARNSAGGLLGLGGWVAGAPPLTYPAGLPRALRPRTALMLMVHYHPSGKPETDQPELAFYRAAQPPTRNEARLVLGSDRLDIPASASGVQVRDSFVLPVPVELLSLFPHAHYLCREVQADARLPDGRRAPLLRIEDWDYGWQESYRFSTPVKLPAGTRVEAVFTYDNSADNPRNPNWPPRRVVAGPLPTDEMCELSLQLASDNAADMQTLSRAIIARRLNRMVPAPRPDE